MGLIKAILSALAAFLGFLKDRQLIEAGKKEAQGEQARETLETLREVRAPITDADRERVWSQLQAERDKRRLPTDPGT